MTLCAVLAITLVPSCISQRTDPVALFGPAAVAWPGVADDYARGIDDGVEDGDITPTDASELQADGIRMKFALDTKSREQIMAVPWDTMEPWADRGIDDKLEDQDIGPGVAASLRERVDNFTKTVNRIKGL
jgi:hypothetical protein